MRQTTLIAVLCVMGMLACSTTRKTHVKKIRYSRDYIYAAEMSLSKARNASDVIRALRPHWLNPRGSNFRSYPDLYVDGNNRGGIPGLSTIATAHISQIQFFNAADAFIRFGPDHPAGVILVTTN